MKNKIKKCVSLGIVLLFSMFFIVSCDEDPTSSLWDNPDLQKPVGDTPVITSLTPANGAIAEITEIVITGTNFTSDTSNIRVYFNGVPGNIKSTSATSINVISPELEGDSVAVKIYVKGNRLFSNSCYYKVLPPSKELREFNETDKPKALAIDANGYIYVSLTVNDVGVGIKKIDPATGLMTDYVPKGAETFWSGMKFGPNGQLYAAKNNFGIWKVDQGITPPNTPWVITSPNRITDFDFDPNGYIWAGGAQGKIIRIDTGANKKVYDVGIVTLSARVYKSGSTTYLYIAGTKGGLNKIWRYEIDANDDIINETEYFDFSTNFPTAKLNCMEIASNGKIYIGTDGDDPIIIVNTDGTYEYLYTGKINPEAIAFVWGDKLYFSRNGNVAKEITSTIIGLNVLDTPAPYYGIE
ncbi:MAG: IPT/TIG domain-containing protein [Ignavibacteriales bacterium]|nr:IPT/TIG domain-containing protein [Ignavibacteriales bacterium]